MVFPWLVFASWAEMAFAALMLLPLLFFAACAFYLLRLTLNAALERRRVLVLPRPELVSDAVEAEESSRNTVRVFPASSAASFSASHSADIADAADGSVNGSIVRLTGNQTRFTLLIPAHNEELLLGGRAARSRPNSVSKRSL